MSYFPQVQYFFSTIVVKLCLWHCVCWDGKTLALSNQPRYFFVYCRTSITSRKNVQIKISSALEKWGDQHLFSMFLVPCSSVTLADPLTWAQSEFMDQRRRGKWGKSLSHVCKRAASQERPQWSKSQFCFLSRYPLLWHDNAWGWVPNPSKIRVERDKHHCLQPSVSGTSVSKGCSAFGWSMTAVNLTEAMLKMTELTTEAEICIF